MPALRALKSGAASPGHNALRQPMNTGRRGSAAPTIPDVLTRLNIRSHSDDEGDDGDEDDIYDGSKAPRVFILIC